MKKRKPYKAEPVEKIAIAPLVAALVGGCLVAIDVAKEKFVVGLATIAGEVIKTIRFNHPIQTGLFLDLLEVLREGMQGPMSAVMEPTGTYGDALRYQLNKRGIRVDMVSPKRVHDAKEILDGVPSLHDGKAVSIVAKLHGDGLFRGWTERSDRERALRTLVEQRRVFSDPLSQCFGRLEAWFSRNCPEFNLYLTVTEHRSALKILAEYGGPGPIAAAQDEARKYLRKCSHGRLAKEIIDGLVDSAQSTFGLTQGNWLILVD